MKFAIALALSFTVSAASAEVTTGTIVKTGSEISGEILAPEFCNNTQSSRRSHGHGSIQ